MKMPFGKHKGLELEDLAKDYPEYLVWLAEKCELRGDLFYFVGENYEDCKTKARKNRNKDRFWSDDDIATMEADMKYEYEMETGMDWGVEDYSYPIPNFDY
jgi:hypothetical protein